MNSYGVADWLGYLSYEEIDALKELAQSLPDQPQVVNIGAGGGTSGIAFLESRSDLMLSSIDVQYESSPLGCLEGEEKILEQSGLEWRGRYIQIEGDSKEIPWALLVDMVFIDGDHTYEGCRGDIERWLVYLKSNGILVLHDYQKAADDKPHPGVDRAVDELLVGHHEQILHVDTLIAFRKE